MNYTECIENARPRLGKYCKACPECNGRACKNQMPGPGSKGIGDTAIRNYDKWKQIRVNMDTIAENKPVDTSLSLFGRTFKYPVFAGPVGAVQLHYGDCLDDVAYNDILVSACAKNGIAAFTGDGTDPNVMAAATKAIKNADGAGIPTVKPWNIETIREKMKLVHESGAFAVAMDIDAAGLPFLKNLDPTAGMTDEQKERFIKKLYAKIQSGKKLTPDEMQYLRQNDPVTYMKVARVQAQREALETQLKSCKSKEEAQNIYLDKVSRISEDDPARQERRAAYDDAFDEYRKSGDYKSLPDTEKEIRRNRENNSKGRK